MTKEILLYSPIYSFTAADFIEQMEANKGNDITVRMNCPGGEVYGAYGMYAKYAEHTKGKTLKVDGMAKSGGFFFCVYADDVECLDVSDFMIHRAAYPSWMEEDPEIFTDEVKAQLTKINTSLQAATEAKIAPATFHLITGVTLDEVFSLNSRIDVNITAAQAKEMGLVNRVNALTPAKKNEIHALASSYGVAAFSTEPVLTQTTNIMTSADFKAANPAAYDAIVKEGADAEKMRVSSLMVFHDVDPKAVAEAIENGGTLTPKMTAEFQRKMFAKAGLANIAADATADVTTGVTDNTTTAEQAANADFMAQVKANVKKMTPKI